MPDDSEKCEDCLCDEPLTLAESFSIMREKAAALEHEQWAHWTEYMLNNLTPENIERWKRQIKIPYAELSEKEKDSDRKWADRGITIYSEFAVNV
jgi:hypothetical protein